MINFRIIEFTKSQQKTNRVFWIAALLGILVALFFSNPEKISITKCYFHNITGYSCPTCGLSRSLYNAAHFDLQESVNFHLMGPIIYFALLVFCLKFTFEIIAGREIQVIIEPSIRKVVITSFLIIWLLFMLIRFVGEL